MPGTEIVGRDKELQTISSFLEQDPPSGALLIQGDAGIGKTTLWRAGVEAARELSYAFCGRALRRRRRRSRTAS